MWTTLKKATRAGAQAVARITPQPVALFITRYRLALAIAGVIVIAVIQTIVSVGMYVSSSTYGLDLSRPEFERAKRQVQPHAPQTSFDSTGPINPEVIEKFTKLYDQQASSLGDNGRYDGTPLGDAELRFSPETADQASPQ